jgi:hypothetical protein
MLLQCLLALSWIKHCINYHFSLSFKHHGLQYIFVGVIAETFILNVGLHVYHHGNVTY